MRVSTMSLALAIAAAALATPALAASNGPPIDHFATAWNASPSASFTPGVTAKVATLAIRQTTIPAGALTDAFASTANDGFRRDLAINEIAASWQPAQRTALEDLRDTQRAWSAMAGDESGARDATFVAMLRDVAIGQGRSVANTSADSESGLDAAYADAIRKLPDDKLDALDASEKAWMAYRDAFARFAVAMDHPDAATAVRDDLARRRTQELRAMSDGQ